MTATRPAKTALNLALAAYVSLGAIGLRGAPPENSAPLQTNNAPKVQMSDISSTDATGRAKKYMNEHREYMKTHGMGEAQIWGVVSSSYNGKGCYAVVLVSTNKEYVPPGPTMYLYVDKKTGQITPRPL